ncbi:glycoside hydrolase, family 5 [Artemisia annua]|uniref:mannan endo-1,4-beta-mannosidase n=1 Tax=Artemisia annua TaxID=35608 RepID=A0A2U1M111_ARTAN|nr:glycoside hydrolase, family 5 [Artemisia annua]
MSGNDVVIRVCKVTDFPCKVNTKFAYIRTNQFVVNGKSLYFNGFNAYWLMCMASDPSTRTKVAHAFQEASRLGMNIVRTWAFSDGGNKPLQTSPGSYNEDMFKGLDFVVLQAKKYELHIIFSLVNNWDDFGGKKQYVQWARDHGGQYLNNDDEFFSNVVVREYYKNHVKSVLTRQNSITGVAYKDDPTIFAWELINEPRCESDLSGKTLEEWIVEMAAEIKSIDKNHLVECGLEGFYGESMPDKKQNNPGFEVGTDFISNNRINDIDFATIHIYPDQWVSGDKEAQAKFAKKWIKSHIEDCNSVLRKPLLITEFGKSSRSKGYTVKQRDEYFRNIFNTAYQSAKSGGSCSGTMFWQVLAKGMENWGDSYQVVLENNPSTNAVISQQSQKISSIDSPMKTQLLVNRKKIIINFMKIIILGVIISLVFILQGIYETSNIKNLILKN